MTTQIEDTFQSQEPRLAIRLSAQAERAVRNNHPWIYADSIISQNQPGKTGQLAVIFDRRRHFLAIGLYDPHSVIRVRLLAFNHPVTISSAWLANKIQTVNRKRDKLPAGTNAYRIVHGENDGLPGLVIDQYKNIAVIKLYTLAWFPHIDDICRALHALRHWDLIVLRISRSIQPAASELYDLSDGAILYEDNPEYPILFQENNLTFEVDPFKGHKTGFYLDQRDNRAQVAKRTTGKRVLNLFAYTGAFSVYAARGGAAQITSIDISRQALAALSRNVACNTSYLNIRKAQFRNIQADVFEYLQQASDTNYDLLIVDPPSFASKKEQIPQAIKAYRKLTEMSLSHLKSGGILVQSSCSGKVPSEAFFDAVLEVVSSECKTYTILDKTYHPFDHPIGFKEGAYLKTIYIKIHKSHVRDRMKKRKKVET